MEGKKYFIEVEINNERRLIHELAELFRWVLDIEVNEQASNNNPHKYFMIIHENGEELGTLLECGTVGFYCAAGIDRLYLVYFVYFVYFV